jgi:hypothetical protein
MKTPWIFLILVLGFSLSAYEVDKVELQNLKNGAVEFINYEGPHDRLDSLAEIKGIGQFLGRNYDPDEETVFEFYGKYRIIHAVDSTAEKKSADILILEADAQVDHIRNLRLIIQGYLEEAYGYSEVDARLLAEFITIYNAVYRFQIEAFRERFHAGVISKLDPSKVGLAKVYSEWPGQTQIVIPLIRDVLTDEFKGPDTDELSDEEVVDNLRETEDMGIDQRKEITELKEREIEEDEAAIAEEEARIREEEARLEAEDAAIDDAQADLDQRREEAEANGDTEELERIEEEQAALDERREQVEQDREQVEQDREQVTQARERTEERSNTVQEDRESIASDERSQADTPLAPLVGDEDKVYFLLMSDISGEPYGTLLLIGEESGRTYGTSEYSTIRNKQYDVMGEQILVLAGRTEGTGAVRLVMLDAEDLSVKIEGTDDIFRDSVVVVTGGEIYAIIERNNINYLGKFNQSLDLEAVSDAAVDPFSSLTISGQRVFAQSASGSVLILRRSDLKEVVAE